MSNIDNIIADITEVNRTYGFYIRDEDGNLRNDIVCGEVIPFLEELKNYEIDLSQEQIKKMIEFWDETRICNGYNTYNWGANIDHNIDYRIAKSTRDSILIAFMVHRCGDVRANYTDWAMCKFEDEEEFYGLESIMQYKQINERYVADINIFSESFNVYDCIKGEDVGEFWDIEVESLLKSIKELEIKRNK